MSGQTSWKLLGLALWLALTPGCGAGLVTGAITSGGGDPAGSRPPSLSLPGADFPLSPVPSAVARTVVIANAQLAPTADLQVQVRVHAAGDPTAPVLAAANQRALRISGQGGSTVVGFDLDTAPIVAQFGVDADIPARLVVLVDGRELAPPVEVTLLRQVSLRLYDGAALFLSPLGDRIRLVARGLRSADAVGLQVSVTTVDPTGVAALVTRVCLRPAFELPGPLDPPLLADEQIVTAEAPGNTFSGPAQFVVDDAVAGRSASVSGAYYRPDVAVALPSQGSTRGGTEVTLIGRALAPLQPGVVPGEPDFDQLQILLRKGEGGVEREIELPGENLHRPESTLDRLVFTMPSSPDGRPGNVDIVLRTRLVTAGPLSAPEVTAEVVVAGVFLFANPEPTFGPRGTVLAGDPIAVAPIALEGAPASTQATDFGVLYAQGNFAALQLLLSQENGMFIRYFGPARLIGDSAVRAERSPRDLLAGDFDSDGVPDLMIVNGGFVDALTSEATHHVVLGQSAPLPPLGAAVRVPTAHGGMAKGRVCDLNRDGRDDVVLFPGSDAAATQGPIVLLQLAVPSVDPLASPFEPPIAVPVRPYPCDAFEVFDIDGDGFLDVAVTAGGLRMQLDIAWGDGFRGFAGTTQLDLNVPGYQPHAQSLAVGLHAMDAAPRPLALVLEGRPAIISGGLPAPHPQTPPLLVFSRPRPGQPRVYDQPQPGDVSSVSIDPFRSSLAVNLDGPSTVRDELIVGSTAEKVVIALAVFRIDPFSHQFVFAPELLPRFVGREVSSLYLGVAFPANPARGQDVVPALFAQHELTTDGQVERRLSTLLVAQPPALLELLAPDVGFGVLLRGVVGGRFSDAGVASGGTTRDLAVPGPQQILLGHNNGFGSLAPGRRMVQPGMVPESTARVPGPPGRAETLVFFDDGARDGRSDGQLRIGTWQPNLETPATSQQVPTSFSANLRPLLPAALAAATIDSTSRLQAEDVDGDGRVDLCVLLRFVGRRSEGSAVLMLLRGRADALPAEFPFALPVAASVTAVHGNATSFALGDFALEGQGQPVQLELALAVPQSSIATADDGDHVRFHRLVGQPMPHWQRSFAPGGLRVLIAGNAPTRLAAADFDGNGSIDLLVAADGDASLRLFLNTGVPAADPAEVALESFHEGLGSPLPTPPGRHTNLLLGDINGDGNVDALLATESTQVGGGLTSSVAFYLSSGTGEFASPELVSPTRLGDRDALLSVDLGDINSDSVPDLSVGWTQQVNGDDNLRVLLGGSR